MDENDCKYSGLTTISKITENKLQIIYPIIPVLQKRCFIRKNQKNDLKDIAKY